MYGRKILGGFRFFSNKTLANQTILQSVGEGGLTPLNISPTMINFKLVFADFSTLNTHKNGHFRAETKCYPSCLARYYTSFLYNYMRFWNSDFFTFCKINQKNSRENRVNFPNITPIFVHSHRHKTFINIRIKYSPLEKLHMKFN